MQSTRILAASADFDPSKRTVLPASAGVHPIRFRSSTWQQSSFVREILDSFAHTPLQPAPRIVADTDNSESIILSGNEIFNSLHTGSHVVKQRRTVDFETLPELAIVPEPFAPVVSTARDDAAEALRAMDRKPHARRSHRLPRKPLTTPRTASTGALVTALIIAAVVVGVLLRVVTAGRLF